jgi:hypothetical protein
MYEEAGLNAAHIATLARVTLKPATAEEIARGGARPGLHAS